MYKRVSWLAVLLIFAGHCFTAQAQTEHSKKQLELNMVWGMAQGSFGDNLDRPIPGILFSFGGETPNLPLELSTELGWMNYGLDNHLNLRINNTGNTISASAVNIEAANSIFTTHLVAQLSPLEGKISPYIGGLFGFKYISTRVDVESETLDDNDIIFVDSDDQLRTSSRFSSLTMSYGVKAGLDIQIFDRKLGLHDSQTFISLHFGARYLFGTEADYLTEDSIQPQADGIRFEQVESDTDILIPEVGFQVGI